MLVCIRLLLVVVSDHSVLRNVISARFANANLGIGKHGGGVPNRAQYLARIHHASQVPQGND